VTGGEDAVARAEAEPVEVVDYDAAWIDRFAEEAAHLRACLPAHVIGRIEHFGSTAVPGLAAKPIVDIMVEVSSLEDVRNTIAPILRGQGYEFFWRPVAPGSPEIDYAWFIKRDAAGRRTHHVHFVPAGSAYWDRLVFRDRLIADSRLAAEYAELKRRAARAHPGDRKAYAKAKSAFIQSVMLGEV
jgi:GrpB-like predicted nucleotidyltransferase (UPF0157 family)